jgi:general secretion pathway protein G
MKKYAAQGFTLIELLIVMVILGLLAGLVGPRMFGRVGSAKTGTARTQIELLGTALDTYRLDNSMYPTTAQGLNALREKPQGVDTWRGPYLPKPGPNDPWDRPYIYKSPGDHGDYDLSSLGLDGQPGGEDENADVNSWEN